MFAGFETQHLCSQLAPRHVKLDMFVLKRGVKGAFLLLEIPIMCMFSNFEIIISFALRTFRIGQV